MTLQIEQLISIIGNNDRDGGGDGGDGVGDGGDGGGDGDDDDLCLCLDWCV